MRLSHLAVRLFDRVRAHPLETSSIFEVRKSAFFSFDWYRAQVPEVENVEQAVADYLTRGWLVGKSPHPLFDGDWYLDVYSDVLSTALNPLVHYLRYGRFEGRSPHPLITPELLVDQALSFRDELADEDIVLKYLTDKALWDFWSCDSFLGAWYLEHYPDVGLEGVHPLVHYVIHGEKEGRTPSPIFDPFFYKSIAADAEASKVGLLAHFHLQGWQESRSPSEGVDMDWVTIAASAVGERKSASPKALRLMVEGGYSLNDEAEMVAYLRYNPKFMSAAQHSDQLTLRCDGQATILDSGQFLNAMDVTTEMAESPTTNEELSFEIGAQYPFLVELSGPWVLDLSWIRFSLGGSRSRERWQLQTFFARLSNARASLDHWGRNLTSESNLSLQLELLARAAAGNSLVGRTLVSTRSVTQGPLGRGAPRILLISHEHSLTGAPIYLEQVAQMFVKARADVLIVSLRDDIESDVFTRSGLNHVLLGSMCHTAKAISPDWELTEAGRTALAALIRGFGPTGAVISTVNASGAARVLFEAGVPYSMYIHERTGPSTWHNSPFAKFDRQVKLSMVGAEALWFGSTDTKTVWERYSTANRTNVVRTWRNESFDVEASDVSESRVTARAKLGIGTSNYVFMYVATFEHRKRQIDLVKAFEMLSAPNSHLVLVGDGGATGEEINEVRFRAAKRGSRIVILGSVGADRHLYQIADCFVMASDRETFPLSVQEASICGLPVIVSRYSGWEDLFPTDYALSYPVGDVEKLCSLMGGALNSNPVTALEAERLTAHISQSRTAEEAIILASLDSPSSPPNVVFGPRGWAGHV